MPHLSKVEIERRLLSGMPIQWSDATGKSTDMFLGTAKERRLLKFLLGSSVRDAINLPDAFVTGLQSAFDAADDPAKSVSKIAPTIQSDVWRLKAMETEGFGGINIWQGKPFRLEFDNASMLLEGPNGSGKSSLTGALVWALSGERPRDHAPDSAHIPSPVFDSNDQSIGQWPPLATYPPSVKELQTSPKVRVALTFENEKGQEALVERVCVNGVMHFSADPQFKVPPVLIETGLLMPARLSSIRLDEGRGRLTDAVQKLTGLDDLIAIAVLTEGLTHKARDYQSFKKQEFRDAQRDFESALKAAREEMSAVSIAVPPFTPADTGDAGGAMANLGKSLAEKSNELTAVISGDIGSKVDLLSLAGQNQVISAIGAAKEDVSHGLDAISFWANLVSISASIAVEGKALLLAAITEAEQQIAAAVGLRQRTQLDSKFQLKALSARWHADHLPGDVQNCPLCEHSLETNPALKNDIDQLRSAGVAATKTFEDTLTSIQASLEEALPSAWRTLDSTTLSWDVRAQLQKEIAIRLVHKDRYSKVLVRFGAIATASLEACPLGGPPNPAFPDAEKALQKLETRMAVARHLIGISEWFKSSEESWRKWWAGLIEGATDNKQNQGLDGETGALAGPSEGLAQHLDRLSDALEKSGPYRKAALAMREAWKKGKAAAVIQAEITRRQEIGQTLLPLKNLKPLCECIARETIDELSSSISILLKQIHLTETLHFQKAKLERKTGLAVQGSLVPGLRIDATLVANTSWLRAILWAFIFALREKAVKQLGADVFPVLVFDDPQSTFDTQHRHRWAQYIASLQAASTPTQIIITTHDETFLALIRVDGVSGREALLASAGPELGHLGILEGASISREWDRAKLLNSAKAGRDFLSAARIYVEGILKLMLRGEGISPNQAALGDCREKIRILNQSGGGVAPWNRNEFHKLVQKLDKNLSEIKHMEMAHHTSGLHLGIAEASDAFRHLDKDLLPALDTGFRLIRVHQLLHGGLKALHLPPPTKLFPDASKLGVRNIPLSILGRAAALTNGEVADGRLDLDEFQPSHHKKIVLAQHTAFRLLSSTLEPMARWGDLLLVLESGEPTPRSLVVAIDGNRLLARRFDIAENSSDLAVLTAQAVNPHAIAAPLVVQRATLTMRSIVGILYGNNVVGAAVPAGSEVGECDSDVEFAALGKKALGLVEVVGRSAEPFALDGQYLVVRAEIDGAEALKTMSGKPVIAGDTENNRYFKRLRAESGDRVVLESLESSGDFEPVVLLPPGGQGNCLERVWPVAGVLFELPNH